MTDHPIQLQDWQMDASLILLPLTPQPEKESSSWWCWQFAKDAYVDACVRWHKDEPYPMCDSEFLPYQVGDRLYHQEPWAEDYLDGVLTKITLQAVHEICGEDEIGFIEWQPTSTMPPEAARVWRTIKSVKVLQAKDLTDRMIEKAGVTCLSRCYYPAWIIGQPSRKRKTSYEDPASAIQAAWFSVYPDCPWHPNLYLIALEVSK